MAPCVFPSAFPINRNQRLANGAVALRRLSLLRVRRSRATRAPDRSFSILRRLADTNSLREASRSHCVLPWTSTATSPLQRCCAAGHSFRSDNFAQFPVPRLPFPPGLVRVVSLQRWELLPLQPQATCLEELSILLFRSLVLALRGVGALPALEPVGLGPESLSSVSWARNSRE